MKKSLSLAVVRVTVASGVGLKTSGSVIVGGAIVPAASFVITITYYIHERASARIQRFWSPHHGGPALGHAT